MKFKFILSVVALAWAGPAFADMTAHYVGLDDQRMLTVEIAGDGDRDLRMTFQGDPNYFLTHAGRDYLVKTSATGSTVMRQEDISTAWIERWGPARRSSRRSGQDVGLVARGMVSIRGRKGIGYVARGEGMSGQADEPVLVVSDDPTLAPLAAAMHRQFNTSFRTMQTLFGDASPWSGMAGIFDKGAPLSFLGMRLDTINRDPVPASRFVLPASPILLAEVKRDVASLP